MQDCFHVEVHGHQDRSSPAASDWVLIDECPLCASSARVPWLRAMGLDLVRCATCGHRYSTAVLSPAILAHHYYDEPDAALEGRTQTTKEQRFKEYLELLTPLVTPARVLDVGCNAGELLRLFQQEGFQPFGIEVSPGPARHAERVLGVSIWQGRVEECLPSGERFDIITLSHVLEHIHRPKELLSRLAGALGTRGQLLIEVPNADDFFLDLWRGSYRPLCPGDHVSFFDARRLECLLGSAGYIVKHLVSVTHARDVAYPSILSAVDSVRARSRGATSEGVRDQIRYRGRLRRPLRQLIDALVEVVDPAVVWATKRWAARLRGSVLIAVAESRSR